MRKLVVCLFLLSACRDTEKESGLNETNSPSPQDTQNEAVDADGDGFVVGEDCDDSDDSTYPGAREACDEVDNDCDDQIDGDDIIRFIIRYLGKDKTRQTAVDI